MVDSLNLSWQALMGVLLVPAVIYGILFFSQKFPQTERAASGISYKGMLKACVGPLFIFMVLCMLLTASTELGTGQWIEALLKQAGVDDLVAKRATKDDAAESKPDPDIVCAALARARSGPESSVMIGDTPYDIEAATRAGIKSVALRCGGHWSDEDLRGALYIFDDPQDLLDRWQQSAATVRVYQRA